MTRPVLRLVEQPSPAWRQGYAWFNALVDFGADEGWSIDLVEAVQSHGFALDSDAADDFRDGARTALAAKGSSVF